MTTNPAGAESDRDTVMAAVVWTVLLHLLVLWGLPRSIHLPENRVYQYSQAIDLVLEPIPDALDEEMRYVRATPDVPEEAPEETVNISDRDQMAAQPEEAPTLDPDNTPMRDGDMEESNRLVQGNPFDEPTPPAPPASGDEGAESPMAEQEPAPMQPPAVMAPDFQANDETDPDPNGIAMFPDPALAQERPVEEPQTVEDWATDETSPEDGRGESRVRTPPQQQAEAPSQQPRPRLRVERDTSYGPLRDNREGVIRIGSLAFDSRYSEFGEYWRRVAEIIERRWRNLVYNSRAITFSGSRVVVQFDITRDGRVQNVKVIDSTSGRLAESISIDSIVGEAPFHPWTPDMVLRMGDSAECAIHFFY